MAIQTKDELFLELMMLDGDAPSILNKLSKSNYHGSDFTLEEIGKILRITRERVRQIETTAIKKLKHPNTGKPLLEYLSI